MANTINVEICLDDLDGDELVEFVVEEYEDEVKHELMRSDARPLHRKIQEKRQELRALEDEMLSLYMMHNMGRPAMQRRLQERQQEAELVIA